MLKYYVLSITLHLSVILFIWKITNFYREENYREYKRIYISIKELTSYGKPDAVERANKEPIIKKRSKKKIPKVSKKSKKENPKPLSKNERKEEVNTKKFIDDSEKAEKNSHRNFKEPNYGAKSKGRTEQIHEKSEGIYSKSNEIKERSIDKNSKMNNVLEEDLKVIREIIKSHIEYPLVARKMGWEGTVVIKFTLTEKGRISHIEIVKSSGYSILDEYTVNLIKDLSSKFPRPPKVVTIKIPVSYHLN